MEKQENISVCGTDCGACYCFGKIWLDTRDPKFSDEEFNRNVAARVQMLRKK